MGMFDFLRKRWLTILHDLAWVVAAMLAAYWIRFNLGAIPGSELVPFLLLIAVAVPVHAVTFWLFGCVRGIWRFASIPDLLRFVKAILVGALVTAAVFLAYSPFAEPPRAVLALYPVFLLLGVVGARVVYRVLADYSLMPDQIRDRHALLIGAGRAGDLLVRDLVAKGPFVPVGILDDDPAKLGNELQGVRVVGKVKDLERIARKSSVDAVLVAMPSAPKKTLEHIVTACANLGIECRTMPSLNEIAEGRVTFTSLRPVTVEDLLGRDPVVLSEESVAGFIKGKRVMVTGGGGSIGAELCRQVLRYAPASLVILENSEFNLYSIEQELRAMDTGAVIEAVLGDCKHKALVERLLARTRPDVIFHSAAYKHVPLVECNALEGVRNNVLGTRVMADCAAAAGVGTFVLISTDKTVNPANVMGASKRVAEIYCQAMSRRADTHFITTRFGNVLGSAGSVVPLFEAQIRRGGPVTVTHPEVTRFFMTIPEAVSLILQAGAMGKGGEIFVLDMGEPVRILDLAEKMIQLSGLQPGRDIEIEITGLRPGEKLYEELFYSVEELGRTVHPKLLLASGNGIEWAPVSEGMDRLQAVLDQADVDALIVRLRELVPEFRYLDDDGGFVQPHLKVVRS